MALQDHARLAVFIDQTFLSTASSITFTTNSGQQRVDTLEGLAGFTPGSGDVSVTVNYVVPIGGEQYDFQAATVEGRYVAIQIVQGPVQYQGTGKIMDTETSQSVNANTEGTFNWVGELKPLQ